MVINLNKYRKERKRSAQERLSVENRARFGRSKSERANDLREQERTKKEMEHKRLD